MVQGRRVLISGAAGFIGANLVRRLQRGGAVVTAVVRPESHLWRLEGLADDVIVVRADIAGLSANQLPGPIDVFVHLAAAGVDPARGTERELLATNVQGTLRALETARELGASRFVCCGSCFEYGEGRGWSEEALPTPRAVYGATKAAAWLLAHALGRRFGLDVVSLRPFTVYGPLEAPHRLIPFSILRALDGEPLELTGGLQTRDFVYVDDVVEAFVCALVSPAAAGGTFNVCTGVEHSVQEVVSMVVDLTGCASRPVFGAKPYRDAEIWTLSGDPRRAREVLGWTARTTLREGLERTIAWFRDHRRYHASYAVSA